MGAINKKSYNKIKSLYIDGYSAKEIADQYKVSLDAVFYFLRKYNIPRRNAAECNFVKFKKKKPSFKLKYKLFEKDKILKIAGVMLYWGEGSQWAGEKIVDFANSNPEMIIIFLKFLRKICGINESKLRAYLYCYNNQNIQKTLNYWSKITNIPKNQFTKPYIRKDYQKSKINKMKNGLIHVRYNDKKLLDLIRFWIKNYINNGSVA